MLAVALVQLPLRETRSDLPQCHTGAERLCRENAAIRILSLQESGIPVPNHICVNRDDLPEGQDPEGFVETEDYVEVDGEL